MYWFLVYIKWVATLRIESNTRTWSWKYIKYWTSCLQLPTLGLCHQTSTAEWPSHVTYWRLIWIFPGALSQMCDRFNCRPPALLFNGSCWALLVLVLWCTRPKTGQSTSISETLVKKSKRCCAFVLRRAVVQGRDLGSHLGACSEPSLNMGGVLPFHLSYMWDRALGNIPSCLHMSWKVIPLWKFSGISPNIGTCKQ